MFADEVKLTKGTCWLVVMGAVLLNFLFFFASVVWLDKDTGRQAELNAIQIRESREDLTAFSQKLDDIQKSLSTQAIKDAEIKGRDFGYRVGRVDREKGH